MKKESRGEGPFSIALGAVLAGLFYGWLHSFQNWDFLVICALLAVGCSIAGTIQLVRRLVRRTKTS